MLSLGGFCQGVTVTHSLPLPLTPSLPPSLPPLPPSRIKGLAVVCDSPSPGFADEGTRHRRDSQTQGLAAVGTRQRRSSPTTGLADEGASHRRDSVSQGRGAATTRTSWNSSPSRFANTWTYCFQIAAAGTRQGRALAPLGLGTVRFFFHSDSVQSLAGFGQ